MLKSQCKLLEPSLVQNLVDYRVYQNREEGVREQRKWEWKCHFFVSTVTLGSLKVAQDVHKYTTSKRIELESAGWSGLVRF